VARHFNPLLVNTVVGFIGPEYLYDGKQIIRAGLEDHFCGKLMGLPIGCDVCYTNHAEADQDDMDTLLTLLCNAGLTFLIGVPGADDIMLNYQSTSRRPLCPPSAGAETCARVRRLAHPYADYRYPRTVAFNRGEPPAADRITTRSERMNPPDAWTLLREFTDARIALGRSGASLPTREVLNFGLAHAQARDAIHQPFDSESLATQLHELGLQTLNAHSAATDRHIYLNRPDLGACSAKRAAMR
jgi:hypothetical protein